MDGSGLRVEWYGTQNCTRGDLQVKVESRKRNSDRLGYPRSGDMGTLEHMLVLLNGTTPDTTEAKWALVGVVIGAIVAGFAQILASWLQWRREEKHALRTRRADNLYVLQDQLQLLLETSRKIINQLDDPRTFGAAIFLWDDTELKNQMTRLEALSIRVGDDPLSERVDAALIKLYESAQYKKSSKERRTLFYEARGELERVQLRVGVLLHTDTNTDIGLGGKPGWIKWRQRRRYNVLIRNPPTKKEERLPLEKAKNSYDADQVQRARSTANRLTSLKSRIASLRRHNDDR